MAQSVSRSRAQAPRDDDAGPSRLRALLARVLRPRTGRRARSQQAAQAVLGSRTAQRARSVDLRRHEAPAPAADALGRRAGTQARSRGGALEALRARRNALIADRTTRSLECRLSGAGCPEIRMRGRARANFCGS